MVDTPIPTYPDLMYPTLIAVQQLGGSAAIAELDEAVLEVAAVTEEQLAVEYPPEASSSGSKVVHRLHWARTYLKAIGALENSERGTWSLTKEGLAFINMDPSRADEALRVADNEVRAKWRKARKEREAETDSSDGEIDEDADEEATWKEELLSIIKVNSAGCIRASGDAPPETNTSLVSEDVVGSRSSAVDGHGHGASSRDERSSRQPRVDVTWHARGGPCGASGW